MNERVSYELAKLLAEKGFEIKERPMFYFDFSTQTGVYMYNGEGSLVLCSMPLVCIKNNWIDAPTIAEVVDWIYEKYSIWIEVHGWTNQPVGDEIWLNCFQSFVNGDSMDVRIFKSPTEAYEAAIEYCLKNLIKWN